MHQIRQEAKQCRMEGEKRKCKKTGGCERDWGGKGKYETAHTMTASERMAEVKIYLILFLQDNSLAV